MSCETIFIIIKHYKNEHNIVATSQVQDGSKTLTDGFAQGIVIGLRREDSIESGAGSTQGARQQTSDSQHSEEHSRLSQEYAQDEGPVHRGQLDTYQGGEDD